MKKTPTELTLTDVIRRAINIGKKEEFCLDFGKILPLFFPRISYGEVQEGIALLQRRKDVSVEEWENDCYFISPLKKGKQKQ